VEMVVVFALKIGFIHIEIDAIEMARDFFDEPYKSKFQQILVALGPSTCRKHLKAKKGGKS
jgi:hypothetical protein